MLKGKVRPRWLKFGIGLALLAAAMVAVLSLGRTPPPTPLPNPNGYDDLLRAGQAVAQKADGASRLDQDSLRALVATNQEALRLLRVGLARRCAVPTDALITNFAATVGDLVRLKSLAYVLSAEGRLAELENRPADAARSYLDTMRLGTEMSRGGLLIHRLVGIACEATGNMPLVKLLPELPGKDLPPLIQGLEELNDHAVPWQEIRQNEMRYVRARMSGCPNPFKLISSLWEAHNSQKATQDRVELAAAHVRLLMVELALRGYRHDRGSAPATLSQLVPQYLRRLPDDPFSGKSLVYRPAGTNWVLYSFGPDRTDDGGKPVGSIIWPNGAVDFPGLRPAQVPAKGDLFYDSGW